MVRRIVFVSTYPPTHCGIATFSQDLLNGMRLLLPDLEFSVCAVSQNEHVEQVYPPEVIMEIDHKNPKSYIKAARLINRRADDTIVVIQHEYGIYGGPWGKYLLEFMRTLRTPIITTMHTAVADPPKLLSQVTKQIISYSDQLVALTKDSSKLISSTYPASSKKITLIPHGIHPLIFSSPQHSKTQLKIGNRKVLLTFGLLNRNKGIEFVIQALPKVASKFPEVLYLIVGRTHPNIIREEGESYRTELEKLVKGLGVQGHVRFIDKYLPLKDILLYLQPADIYLAPSLNPQQAVSGTLTYALGAGRAVVATDFAQAKELLDPSVGQVVPTKNSEAIAQAVVGLLGKPKKLRAMHEAAYSLTRSMAWPNVANNYITLISSIAKKHRTTLSVYPVFDIHHLKTLTDDFGLIQFAVGSRPRLSSGYTLDDNSRALQLVISAEQTAKSPQTSLLASMAKKYLSVMEACLGQSPHVNYLSYSTKKPSSQNLRENLDDSLARAYFALQAAANTTLIPSKIPRQLVDSYPRERKYKSLRPAAFYLLGDCVALESGDKAALKSVHQSARELVNAYRQNSAKDWKWFEPMMTYANGQFCRSLLEAARLTGSSLYAKIGLESLDFLISVCFMGEVYVPIGQDGWYQRGQQRALFDQQPEDVLATIEALESANRLAPNDKYVSLAHKAFSWFLGNNLVGFRMYDDASGGCRDGLKPYRVNNNKGAESTLSYLQARLAIERLGF